MGGRKHSEKERCERGRVCNLSIQVKRQNRTRYDIEYEILEYCASPKMKTHVMYHANLSFDMIQRYLNSMMERGLLSFSEDSETGRGRYLTTSEGRKFIVAYLTLGNATTKKNGGEQ